MAKGVGIKYGRSGTGRPGTSAPSKPKVQAANYGKGQARTKPPLKTGGK